MGKILENLKGIKIPHDNFIKSTMILFLSINMRNYFKGMNPILPTRFIGLPLVDDSILVLNNFSCKSFELNYFYKYRISSTS